jgi:hypothetical protein
MPMLVNTVAIAMKASELVMQDFIVSSQDSSDRFEIVPGCGPVSTITLRA